MHKKQNRIKNKAHSIVYASGKYKNITHSRQRSFIDDYAKENNFEIVTENSELLGCEGLPQIIDLVDNSSESIILFSYHNLSNKQILILKNLDPEKQNRIIFALESISLNDLKIWKFFYFFFKYPEKFEDSNKPSLISSFK